MSHITSLILLTEHPHLFRIHSLMHTCFNVLSVCICDYKCYCGIWEAAIGDVSYSSSLIQWVQLWGHKEPISQLWEAGSMATKYSTHWFMLLCSIVVAHWMLGFSPQSSGKPSNHIIHVVQEWQECITQCGNTGEYHVSVMWLSCEYHESIM